MTSNRQDQQMKIYRIKIKKRTVIPPDSSKVAIVELDEKPMNDIKSYLVEVASFAQGQQWQTFEEEVDFVVPLTIRRLVDDDSYNTNWTPSYSPVELHEEQMKDPDLKTLKRWIEDKYEPTKAELKLCSEVVRHFWSLRQQIQIKDNILLYKWEDPISPRLLFMTPKQMQKELLHGCHDVVSSGTSNWNADRKEVPQYIKDLVENLKRVHAIARDNLKASQERQKGIYDLKYNQNIYNVGDVVYKLNQATKGGSVWKIEISVERTIFDNSLAITCIIQD
ncbi:unnamed protein product [Mytilus coruscus]|uniref:Uncharacterized protein n=1 Tax=Mytilus coruscus TaxID=42192 RepID=A0A6J7ZV78_MYTCO|nr:unnamed protein product [Mytilus coruscus]